VLELSGRPVTTADALALLPRFTGLTPEPATGAWVGTWESVARAGAIVTRYEEVGRER
jgi:hypothetical protein